MTTEPFEVDCIGVARSGRVKHFGLSVRAWALLPDTVMLRFAFPARGKRRATSDEVTRIVELKLHRFERDTKRAIYMERGAKERKPRWN